MTRHFVDVNMLTARDMRSTYHGYDLSVERDEHIDYCFINDKITALSQRVLDEQVDGKFPSDHFGIYSEIEL